MTTKRLAPLALSLCLLFCAGSAMAARTVPLVDQSTVLDAQSTRTPEQIRDYILYAAGNFRKEFKYTVESDKPGALQLQLNKEDEYFVSVLFTYDTTSIKATYVTSKNLAYREAKGERMIHSNYLVWIDEIFKTAKDAYGMQLTAAGVATNPNALAELTFRSTGATDTVEYQMADWHNACGNYDGIGAVGSWSEAQIAARAQEVKEWPEKSEKLSRSERNRLEPSPYPPRELSKRVAAMQPIQVSASSSAVVYTTPDASQQASSYWSKTPNPSPRKEKHECGPVAFKLTPQGGKKYSIEYALSYAQSPRGTCTMGVFDVTEPGQHVAVPTEAVSVCTRK